jgi:hypothetical protein
MKRLEHVVFLIATIAACWLGMQAVHELGHVVGALLTGTRVENVVLHPLTISRTDLGEGPHPLLVTWAGPLLGVALPLVAWLLAVLIRLPGNFLLRFFAGFCLIANGAYIGGGSFERIGDCGELLRHGAPVWQLWVFGALGVTSGLAAWHGLGADFGIGRSGKPVSRRMTLGVVGLALALVALGLWVDD